MTKETIRSIVGAGLGAFFGIILASTINSMLLVPVGAIIGWLLGCHREAIIPGIKQGIAQSRKVYSRLLTAGKHASRSFAAGVQSKSLAFGHVVKNTIIGVPSGIVWIGARLTTITRTHVELIFKAVMLSHAIGFSVLWLNVMHLIEGHLHAIASDESTYNLYGVLVGIPPLFAIVIGTIWYLSDKWSADSDRVWWSQMDRLSQQGLLRFWFTESWRLTRLIIASYVIGTLFFTGLFIYVVIAFLVLLGIVLPIGLTIVSIFTVALANQYRNFGSLIIGLLVGTLTFLHFRADLVADPMFRLTVATVAGFMAGGLSLFCTHAAAFIRKVPGYIDQPIRLARYHGSELAIAFAARIDPIAIQLGKAIVKFVPPSSSEQPDHLEKNVRHWLRGGTLMLKTA